jgi:hypothetical protein
MGFYYAFMKIGLIKQLNGTFKPAYETTTS